MQKAITPAVEDDIVTPFHWDCMEGRQLSIFFDCLSRHDGKENLYVLAKGTNAPSPDPERVLHELHADEGQYGFCTDRPPSG